MRLLIGFLVPLLHFFNQEFVSATEHEKNKTYVGSFIIVASKSFRSNVPYAVSVNLLENAENVELDVKVVDDQNATVASALGKRFKSNEPQTVTLELQKSFNLVSEDTYKLWVKGSSTKDKKVLFEQLSDIRYNEKSFSVFVQTDKATYKPGASVKFRVMATNPDLTPYKGTATIKIKDPQANIIANYADLKFDHGIIGKNAALSFELSDEPTLGSWSICVNVNGRETSKSFQVEKYVLPKFDVVLKHPSSIVRGQNFNFTVVAIYTYGKGLNGVAEIKIVSPYNYKENKTKDFVKSIEINQDGEAFMQISYAELVSRFIVDEESEDYTSLNIETSVTESLTNTQINTTAYMSISRYAQTLSIKKLSSENFYPGEPYTILISVASYADKFTYVPSKSDFVYLLISSDVYFNGTYDQFKEYRKIDLQKNGTAFVTFNTLKNASNIYLMAKLLLDQKEIKNIANYSDEWWYQGIQSTQYLSPMKSPTLNYLLIKEPTEQAYSVGGSVSLEVSVVASDVPFITSEVLAKTSIVFVKNFPVKNGIATVSIPLSQNMAPRARVVVYGIKTGNKEILVDAVDIKVKGLFKNNVTVDVVPKRTEPNGTVTVSVHASPKSYIGLLAVDKSVLLLRSGNDIAQSEIESEISQYDSLYYSYGPWRMSKRHKRSTNCPDCFSIIRGSDATQIFENCGLVVLTDAYLYSQYENYGDDVTFAAVGGPVAAGPLGPPMDQARTTAVRSEKSESSNQPAKEPAVRKRFLETWIWSDAYAGPDGKAVVVAEAPDTITSYVITAFGMHDTDGFNVAPDAANVEVFRPFFIRLDLPYSVKRGEKLALKVLIFNYKSEEQTVTVTLAQDKQSGFEFVTKPDADKPKKGDDNTKQIRVKENGGSSIAYFPIKPTKLGQVKILIKAFGQDVSDAVEQDLLVEAEGFPLFHNRPFTIDLTKSTSWSNSTQLDFPYKTVPGSQKATVSVSGDIMAPLLNNIGNLIQMPWGCGEQNMLNFVPNIVINKYLRATKHMTPEIEAKSRRYMEIGYQHELTYQHTDSSFSAFGQSDGNGSTWLTAFVAKSFQQAKPYIFIDDTNLNKSLDYLLANLKENGAFAELGEVHDRNLQGGAQEDSIAITAYVYIALLINEKDSPNTLAYLERSLDRITEDSYTLAIVCYALTLSKTSKKMDECLTKLEKLAIKKDDSIHWSKVVKQNGDRKPVWWIRPKPADVETTAYVLLTYMLKGQVDKAFPLVRWLSQQQNSFGGYSSTQDTVVALQALGEFAEKTFSDKTNIVVTIENDGKSHDITLKPDNLLIQQNYQISNVEKSVNLKASGKGVVYGQISWHHNVERLENVKPFLCDKQVHQETANDLTLGLCCKYNLEGKSNMAVMEIELPSGFGIDEEKLNELTLIDQLQRVEAGYGTQANIYFNYLDGNPLCFNVTSERIYGIADQKPANVKLYDYYNTGDRIEFNYELVKKANLTEICGSHCWIIY